MKKLLYVLLLIPYITFGQTPIKGDTVFTRYIKALPKSGISDGKVRITDTIVLKDGTKQVTALTNTLKSNYNTAYSLSHSHANYSALGNITASGDGSQYLANDGTYKTVSSGTTLNGTGLVRMSGTTVSYDNSSYATNAAIQDSLTQLKADTVNSSRNGVMSKYDYVLLLRNTPLTGQTFTGQFNLSTNLYVTYNQYTLNTTIIPTISASPLKNAYCRLVINAGASAVLDPSNMGTLRLGSDAFTPSKLNEITVIQEEEGLYYFIKLLN
jgi:hypothetical protein